jgi:small ligand-binding sensory domain FIST
MPFLSALSTAPSTSDALNEISTTCDKLGSRADLAIAFFSPHHADAAANIAQLIGDRFRPQAFIGCIGEAIVGTGQEIEHAPALSVWLGNWNGRVDVVPFHLVPQQTPDGLSLLGRPDELNDCHPATSTVLVLGDPFTFPAAEIFLPQINIDCPRLRVFGGMASGMSGPGETPLILGSEVHSQGAVGVVVRGAAGVRGVVSQGCRPVGKPFVVTKAQDHHVLELGGKPPFDQLREVFEGLSAHDRELFQRGPHVGLVVNEYQSSFGRGDFLVRNVYAIDRASGAMTITDRVRVGQTVQFHVRDADSADEDLRILLRGVKTEPAAPQAALMFTCNGRGTRMFGAPHHDAGAIQEELGALPIAGLFAAGELGPIGGRNFLHGFTASVVVFDEAR